MHRRSGARPPRGSPLSRLLLRLLLFATLRFLGRTAAGELPAREQHRFGQTWLGDFSVRADNRIKEQQLGLFSDRTSCHAWWANQFRLLLSSLAYVLLEALRRLGLCGTQLARAQVGTIRLRLLKIGAVITRNTRRIRLWLSSSFPLQQLFCSCLVHFYG